MNEIQLGLPVGRATEVDILSPSPPLAHAEITQAPLVFELEDEAAALIGHSSEELDESEETPDHIPLWALPLLVAAVVAVSSAGAVFATMREVPALLLGAWRLQITALFLLPGCIVNYRSLSPELKARTRRSGGAYMISGTSLAVSFACWLWGIEHTSLIHAYLLVSVTPVVIAAGTWLLRRPISNGELAGTVLAALGAGLISFVPAAKGNLQYWDFSSLCAAVALVGYLVVGQRLRAWMPIFLYACPVKGIGAIILSVAATIIDNARPQLLGARGLFGWLCKDYIVTICYLGFVPGIIGHTGLNTLLRFLSPLVISVATAMEPLVESLIGYFILGNLAPPSFWIYVGGGTMLVATVVVTMAQFQRQAKEKQLAEGLSKRSHSLKYSETDLGFNLEVQHV